MYEAPPGLCHHLAEARDSLCALSGENTMAAKQEILKQIDAALELWGTHRAKSKHDDLSDLHDRTLLTEHRRFGRGNRTTTFERRAYFGALTAVFSRSFAVASANKSESLA
jgi:hypothetical protein